MNKLEFKFHCDGAYNTAITFSKELEQIIEEGFSEELEIELLQGKIVYTLLTNRVRYYLNLTEEKMLFMRGFVQNILSCTILLECPLNVN